MSSPNVETAVIRIKLGADLPGKLVSSAATLALLEEGFSASGVFLGRDCLVTTAVIVAPFIGLARTNWRNLVRVEAMWKKDVPTWTRARPLTIARNEAMAKTLAEYISTELKARCLDKNKSKNDAAIEEIVDLQNLSSITIADFLLLSVNDSDDVDCSSHILPASQLQVGEDVYMYGTPFASLLPEIFHNSVSKGVVSNIVGSDGTILLTDARYVVGIEGGALAVKRRGRKYLVGVVVAPLSTDEPCGLTVATSVTSIMNLFWPTIVNRRPLHRRPSLKVADWLRSVAVVETGGRQGSAVIIDGDRKTALTCSHVVFKNPDQRDYVRPSRRQVHSHPNVTVSVPSGNDGTYVRCTAEVMWASAVPDVAVLKLNTREKLQALPLISSGDPSSLYGTEVFVISHPKLFRRPLPPFVSRGVVAKQVDDDDTNKPVMLQLTAAMSGGSSGGAVIHAGSGHLIGIAASTVRDDVTGTVMPTVSLAIPVAWIRPALTEFERDGNSKRFSEIFSNKSSAEKLWQLSSPKSGGMLAKL